MQQLRRHLSYANVMSSLAVFMVVGGGGAVAASDLGKNSVGPKQLKKNSVTKAKIKKNSVNSSKVRNGSLRAQDFKAGQLPAGPTGPKGDAGPEGDAGPKGAKGESGPLLSILPSGQTLRGSFNGGNGAATVGSLVEASISYPFPLATNVTANVIQKGDVSPSQCPGTAENPQAQAGNLCMFVEGSNPSVGSVSSYGPADGASDYRFGAALFAISAAVTNTAEFWGTWAVTAP